MEALAIHRGQRGYDQELDARDMTQRDMQARCDADALKVHLAAMSFQDARGVKPQQSSMVRRDDQRNARGDPQGGGRYTSQYPSNPGSRIVEQPTRHVSFGGPKQQQGGQREMTPETRAKLKALACTLNMTRQCTKDEESCLYSHDEKLRKRTLRLMNEVDASEAKAGAGKVHGAPLPPAAPPERERVQPKAPVSAILRRDGSQTHGGGVNSAGRADSDFEEEL